MRPISESPTGVWTRIGLLEASDLWREILDQEGLKSEVIPPGGIDPVGWSALVVNRLPDEREEMVLKEYLDTGGAIAGYAGYLDGFCGIQSVPDRIEYLLSDGDTFVPDVFMMDVGVDGLIPREANSLRTQSGSNAMFLGPLSRGYIALFPFDPARVMFDGRRSDRCFYSRSERLPSERVSFVAKNEVRHLLHSVLEYLNHVRGLPYVHTSYYPAGESGLFAFRVDTDGANRATINRLYQLATKHQIPMSWYLDIESQESWLGDFGAMSNQEISLHCYAHRQFETGEALAKDIEKARSIMQNAGLDSDGFAAPFGFWNQSVSSAIGAAGFQYSSEFSCAYDTLPFLPLAGSSSQVLQVPVHPICIGSLKRVGYSEHQMKDYFVQVIERKVSRDEPLILYHHPSDGCWDVLEELFQMVHEMRVARMTLLNYARWWKQRRAQVSDVLAGPDGILIESRNPETDDRWLKITLPDRKNLFLPQRAGEFRFANIERAMTQERVAPPPDIRRTREFDARTRMADLYNALLRRFR